MKPSLRVFGLILSCLLVVFIAACAQDQDERVGTYTLVRVEIESEIELPDIEIDITGTLIISSDGRFSMNIEAEGSRSSESGAWTSTTLTGDDGGTTSYSFDGSRTIEMSYSIEGGASSTFVWQKV